MDKKRCLKIIMTKNATWKRKIQLTRTESLLNNKRSKNKRNRFETYAKLAVTETLCNKSTT